MTNLDDLVPEDYELDNEALENASSEEPFIHAAFELMKESTIVLTGLVGMRRIGEPASFERKQAIIAGHLVRVIKLMKSMIRQLADDHGGDLQFAIIRQMIDSIATARYLLGDDGSGSRYDTYMKDSLVSEREFKKIIDSNITQRGSTLPIEERMLRSIDDSFAAAGLSPETIPARASIKWPNIETRVGALGHVAYGTYRTGSNAVHGTFSDIEKHHLIRDGDLFEVDLDPMRWRPQPLLLASLLTVTMAEQYINVWIPEADPIYGSKLRSIHRRMQRVDDLHEAYLVARQSRQAETSKSKPPRKS